MSLKRQCEILGLNRSSFYYQQSADNEADAFLMRVIDEQYTRTPFYGYRRMTIYLQRVGLTLNHKRVRRLIDRKSTV